MLNLNMRRNLRIFTIPLNLILSIRSYNMCFLHLVIVSPKLVFMFLKLSSWCKTQIRLTQALMWSKTMLVSEYWQYVSCIIFIESILFSLSKLKKEKKENQKSKKQKSAIRILLVFFHPGLRNKNRKPLNQRIGSFSFVVQNELKKYALDVWFFLFITL